MHVSRDKRSTRRELRRRQETKQKRGRNNARAQQLTTWTSTARGGAADQGQLSLQPLPRTRRRQQRAKEWNRKLVVVQVDRRQEAEQESRTQGGAASGRLCSTRVILCPHRHLTCNQRKGHNNYLHFLANVKM